MAKAGSSVSPDAWASWSPAILANPTKIPRRYVQIPSDQQKLLDRPDAWSLGRYPNVPPKVLADVRAQSVRDTPPNVSALEETLLSQPASPASPGRAGDDLHRSASPERAVGAGIGLEDDSAKAEEDGNEGVENTPGIPIPWSSSPPEHLLGPHQREEARAKAVSGSSRHSPEQRGPRTTGRVSARAAFLTDFPPSSSAKSDPGLEIEVPNAVTEALEPVNRQAVSVFNHTPPSAQVHISVSAVWPDHQLLVDDTGTARSTWANITGYSIPTASLQPAREQGPSEFPSNTQSDTSSSQAPYTTFKAAYPDYEGSLGVYLRAVLSILPLQKKRALAEFLYDDFVRVFSTDFLTYISGQEANPRPLSAVEFYNENVSRPVYLRGVLTKNNLGETLNKYADEIRAIRGGAVEPQEPEDTTRQRHDQRAPGKAPFERQTAQQPRRRTDTNYASHESDSSSVAVSARPGPGTREVGSPAVPTCAATEPRPTKQVRETVPPPTAGIDVPPPPSTVRSPTEAGKPAREAIVSPSRPVFRTQPDSPSLDIEPSPTPVTPAMSKRTFPAVDKFSGAGLSQASNPESIPETTLKRRAAPRASTGSSTAEPGAEFKRPQAAKTNADKRALRFKKFLMQKRIRSSAPERSTP
ncbi:uncharacterized protein P884DRAFT_217210 [Thermothelomyces heterothallicus CBS 202.75]|uniref:uncharacterized protein n=1 Tax=Thermothelomyces heterothallicus CBS 202.75 TaxID=1149848 RepID=UPI0037425509